MKNIGPLVIAVLCAVVSLFVGFMASPNRRISAILVVSLPFAIGAAAALRRYSRARHAAASRAALPPNEFTLADWVAPVDDFLRDVPMLDQAFCSWATSIAGAAPATLPDLESFLVRHGDRIEPGSLRFLQLVAAYGELLRRSSRGEWRRGRWVYRDEPVIASGRFPYLVHPVLRDAVSLLDAAEDFKHA